jgi:hypothetical protein
MEDEMSDEAKGREVKFYRDFIGAMMGPPQRRKSDRITPLWVAWTVIKVCAFGLAVEYIFMLNGWL